MDDIGLEIPQCLSEAGPGPGQPEVGVPEQRYRRAAQHLGLFMHDRAGTRSDHQSGVPMVLEMLHGSQHGIGDAVDLWQEGLADDGDSHTPTVPGYDAFSGTTAP